MDAHSLVVFSFVEAHHMRLPWDIQDLHGRFEGRICMLEGNYASFRKKIIGYPPNRPAP